MTDETNNLNDEKLRSAYSRLIDKLDHTFQAFESLHSDMSEISELVCAKLLAELRSGSISAYSASCAHTNLINSSTRIQKQIVDIINVVKEAGPVLAADANQRETEDQRKLRKVGEKMLALMARQQAKQPEEQKDDVA